MIFHCPFCGIKVKPADADCPTCRRGMLRRCPHCAEDVSIEATLCKYCGEGLEREETGIVFIDEPAKTAPARASRTLFWILVAAGLAAAGAVACGFAWPI